MLKEYAKTFDEMSHAHNTAKEKAALPGERRPPRSFVHVATWYSVKLYP